MISSRARTTALRGCLGLLLAAGVLVGCGTAPTATPAAPSPAGATAAAERVIKVSQAHGAITGDTGRVQVARGSTVTLEVTSDVADQVHVHGYDKEENIPAGGTATVRFVADIPGVFETELHGSDKQLLQLEVS
ncbi:hypothetical protein LQ327_17440 [Actinomycetospora endophytica]|uniref:EfeO-type cupredoxin-like domain-containing protein n=1 Tax=Actinomycetospora endophytica TaxID=2291215 RepID=A0ABS8PAK5_9PSEU|nr:hypothetical protein [Actinomycetospora endophytica]MCD2195154.1 hypothetical protein [Actinomycetospora endophytica]